MKELEQQDVDEACRERIEQDVDRLGLAHFLGLVADVCNDKYEHLMTGWQDKKTAAEWEKARVQIVYTISRVNV